MQLQQQRLPHSRSTATNLLGLTDLAIHDSDTPLDSGSGASGSSGSTSVGMMGPPASTLSLGRSYGKMRITDEAMPMSSGGLGPGISGRSGGHGGLASAGNILNDMAGMGPGGMSGIMGSMGSMGGGGGGNGGGGGGAGGSSLPSLKASGLLDSWVSPSGNGRSSPSQSRLPTPPWIALMAQSAANAAPHASQNATVTIATSIAELGPADASSKLGPGGGGGADGGGMAQGSGQGHGFGMGMGSGPQQYGMGMGAMGSMGKDGHDGHGQGQGQGISGGMMMTDSVGLGGGGGKSTMPVGLPWLEHERPR